MYAIRTADEDIKLNNNCKYRFFFTELSRNKTGGITHQYSTGHLLFKLHFKYNVNQIEMRLKRNTSTKNWA